MGWSVGWDREHQRFRGYGVPAYCDAEGCDTQIDRGFGFAASEPDGPGADLLSDLPSIFTCVKHTLADVDLEKLPPEHPEWVEFIQTDESWAQWRTENPELLKRWADG